MYNSKFVCKIILLVIILRDVKSDCFYQNYDYKNPGIFLRPFGNDTIIFNPTGPLRIPEEGHVKIYCYSGIENVNYDRDHDSYQWSTYLSEEGEKIKNLTIRCNKHQLDYKIADHNKIQANSKIGCGGTNANFYRYPINNCSYDGFVFGLPLMDYAVILFELCYDLSVNDLLFFRYSAIRRSPFLGKQEGYNPSDIHIKLDGMQKFVFPYKIPKTTQELSFEKFTFATYFGASTFEMGKLISFEKYAKLFDMFLGDASDVNNILWWSSLKNGNWKIFEQLLENVSLMKGMIVTAGKSGVVTYPHDDKCSMTRELQIDIFGTKKTVPLYIWHYIKPKTEQTSNEGVVIIGINSPFVENSNTDSGTKPCDDICDTIPWLTPLNRTRKMVAFGYVHCCKPEDVQHLLDGFPEIDFDMSPDTNAESEDFENSE